MAYRSRGLWASVSHFNQMHFQCFETNSQREPIINRAELQQISPECDRDIFVPSRLANSRLLCRQSIALWDGVQLASTGSYSRHCRAGMNFLVCPLACSDLAQAGGRNTAPRCPTVRPTMCVSPANGPIVFRPLAPRPWIATTRHSYISDNCREWLVGSINKQRNQPSTL